MPDDPNTARDVLRGASDGLLIAIREVEVREGRKRAVRPSDPGFAALAREVRVAAETLLLLAKTEEVKAQETSETDVADRLPTINESTPPPDLAATLAEWRAVERELEATAPASPDAQRLMERFEALRNRYADELKALRERG